MAVSSSSSQSSSQSPGQSPGTATALGEVAEKGLKGGALGLLSSVVIGVASTAPAYSLAATLGFVVAVVGPQAPIIVIIAFVPILFVAIGYRELNRREPDCGTTFTWATKAFGPRTGWLGGWAIVVADVLVMASLAQVAGQYLFLLVGADGIGSNATSGWVLLVGALWMIVMTYICYRGIELSAQFQKVLLSIEIVMLAVFSVVALIRVYIGHGASVSVHPAASWFDPTKIPSFSAFSEGVLLMIFIYWGWDSAVSVNEETAERDKTPGRAAVLSTIVLLVTYALVAVAAQAFAGTGATGIGLGNADNSGDVISVLGHAVFGASTTGDVFTKLLILMVLSSAAASTQTTILPTARTTLSMAVYKAIPRTFAKMHPRYLTPTSSTVVMGAVSLAAYIVMNYASHGNVIADSVSAIGLTIAFYYGLTGFTCFWYYRRELRGSAHDLWIKGIIPLLGGVMLFAALVRTVYDDWHPDFGYTSWLMPFWPHWHIGGIFILGVGSMVLGVVLMFIYEAIRPPFFRGETLNASTPVLVPEDSAVPLVDTD
ncbi:MAG TPA: APC family permease [Mycobacteriales bacterium]|nr:APC family permease [Mycobacteriales bacterium]